MLISILQPIFESCGLSKNSFEFQDYSCWFYINETKSDFFILLDKDNISFDDLVSLEEQGMNQLNEIITEHEASNESYEKNTTLILCVKYDTDFQHSDIVSRIEEDKYLFKKNILFYNTAEVDELTALFDSHYTENKANEILRSEGCFETIQNNRSSGCALLARLFIKLPFLSVQSHQVDIENLSRIIQDEARTQNITSLYNTICNTDIDLSQISSFNDLKLLGLIEEQADE